MHGTWALNYHISNIYSSLLWFSVSQGGVDRHPWNRLVGVLPRKGLYFEDDGDFDRAPVLFLSHRSLSSCSGASDAQIVLVLVLVVVFLIKAGDGDDGRRRSNAEL